MYCRLCPNPETVLDKFLEMKQLTQKSTVLSSTDFVSDKQSLREVFVKLQNMLTLVSHLQ